MASITVEKAVFQVAKSTYKMNWTVAKSDGGEDMMRECLNPATSNKAIRGGAHWGVWGCLASPYRLP